MVDSNRRAAVFLDRDGVINVDHGYVHQIDRFEFLPGIFELARFVATELRWPLIVTTNQAGIGRGYFSEAAYEELTKWMCERFAAAAAPIARVYHCPYHPEAGRAEFRRDHPWRKPRPGMILQAAQDFDLDLKRSIMIGDRMSDMECAAQAGIEVRILLDPHGIEPAQHLPAHDIVRDLPEALALLRARHAAGVAGQGPHVGERSWAGHRPA